MRPTFLLLVFLLVVFVGGALLAPWLYFGVQSLATQFPSLEKLAAAPFHRYVNRCLILLAVLGLYPLLKGLGINSWREIGFHGQDKTKGLLWGFLLGLASLALVATLAVAGGARELNLDHEPSQIIRHLLNATLAAVIVGILEEFIFRGGMFGGLKKTIPWKAALVLSSAVYALVHFFARTTPPPTVAWYTGFIVLGKMSVGFTDFQSLIPAFLNLLIAGMILALAFQFTRNLYMSIGLHAGWIFWLKSYGFLTREKAGANTWFWGTTKLIDGWMALVILVLVLGVVCQMENKKRNLQRNTVLPP